VDGKTLMDNNTLDQSAARMLAALKSYANAVMNVNLACGQPRNDVLVEERRCWVNLLTTVQDHQEEINQFMYNLRSAQRDRDFMPYSGESAKAVE
jgi:hypothetical protein